MPACLQKISTLKGDNSKNIFSLFRDQIIGDLGVIGLI